MFLPTYRRAARDFGADRLRARFGQRKRAVFHAARGHEGLTRRIVRVQRRCREIQQRYKLIYSSQDHQPRVDPSRP